MLRYRFEHRTVDFISWLSIGQQVHWFWSIPFAWFINLFFDSLCIILWSECGISWYENQGYISLSFHHLRCRFLTNDLSIIVVACKQDLPRLIILERLHLFDLCLLCCLLCLLDHDLSFIWIYHCYLDSIIFDSMNWSFYISTIAYDRVRILQLIDIYIFLHKNWDSLELNTWGFDWVQYLDNVARHQNTRRRGNNILPFLMIATVI